MSDTAKQLLALPYWWPVRIDDEYVARLRADYPDETEGMLDEDVLGYFEHHGGKYADTWDHLGDARDDWEALADAFLSLVEEFDVKHRFIRGGQK